ncbi:SDR family oxidoreductase [Gemmata sp. G18]|uniref:SDR family oxidoreductase n=1 Tax=Gemmata palustris TaxID=2822762 RepID=A0ABS5BJD8_9BACT|nr:SDR family oxidoreductase [Gemmata palustris]MBP3953821.1 SDR family oxidoreductase [Gemmata palustris]
MSPLIRPPGTQLVFGCGYLGRRVASRWLAGGHPVAALTRRNADALRNVGIEPVTGDVLDPESLRALPTANTVLYAVGMDRSAGKSMRDVYVTGLAHVLTTLPPCTRFIYASSTSVYGQTNSDWVNEGSPTDPTEESGKVVLEAEQLLRSIKPDAIVLRLAGLYGPDRLLRKQPVLKGEPLVGDADKWLNLVHVADAASAVLWAEAHAAPGETYNVADGTPVSRRDFYTRLAELLHAPEAKFDSRPEQGAPNRRIDAAKFRALGWAPVFTSYREGLTAAVAETTM